MVDQRFVSEMAQAFAMHADGLNLSYEDGLRLAEDIGEECGHAAEDRASIPGIRRESEADDE